MVVVVVVLGLGRMDWRGCGMTLTVVGDVVESIICKSRTEYRGSLFGGDGTMSRNANGWSGYKSTLIGVPSLLINVTTTTNITVRPCFVGWKTIILIRGE